MESHSFSHSRGRNCAPQHEFLTVKKLFFSNMILFNDHQQLMMNKSEATNLDIKGAHVPIFILKHDMC